MVELIAQIFGMVFVCVILVCIVSTFGTYIVEDYKLRKDVDKHREFRNEHGGFLKEVPLVMEKEKFRELKGFPSEEIFGQEDIFLHQNILNSGRKNLEIDFICLTSSKHYEEWKLYEHE